MNKSEYSRAVAEAAMRLARTGHHHETNQQGVGRLAKQYVSIAEQEEQLRAEFSQEIFERAFDAVTYMPENPTFEDLLNHSSLSPHWNELREDACKFIKQAVGVVARRRRRK